jgi:acetyl-CoA carboxylase biotin carboxyl carrier protein
MDIPEMKKLISQMVGYMGRHGLQKLKIRSGDLELELEKPSPITLTGAPMISSMPLASLDLPHEMQKTSAQSAPVAATPKGHIVTSPIVGTFYNASSPSNPPFVKLGDRVEENTIICIVEAMKVMNEIRAGKAGVVEEIYVENGHPVEFGTKIMRIV